MDDLKVSALATIPAMDRAADFLYIVDTSGGTSNKVTPNGMLGITGNPVGTSDSQTLTGKTLTSPTISGPTLSGTLTGTYTIGGTPTFPSSVVTLTGTQTLTNKTLTSPTINTPTITNPTLTIDTISEYTAANGVTIDGVLLKDSKINGTYITNDSITGAQVNWAATGADNGIWWEELGRTTLGSAGDTISVTALPARKYIRVLATLLNSGTITNLIRFNNDSGANYAASIDINNGTTSSNTSQTSITGFLAGSDSALVTLDILNIATQNKPVTACLTVFNSAASSVPPRVEFSAKWVNAADLISRIDFINSNTGDFAIGSEVVILGHN